MVRGGAGRVKSMKKEANETELTNATSRHRTKSWFGWGGECMLLKRRKKKTDGQ